MKQCGAASSPFSCIASSLHSVGPGTLISRRINKEAQTDTQTQKSFNRGPSSLMEKLQHPGNSCTLYSFEHKGEAIAYSSQFSLLYTAEQGPG